MNEESDGINENENNNSEVIILPDRSHVDELLLSEQSDIREDPSEYERKLDEKLRDLGLLEDGMTINQKEELLAVVVISCETAEAEENKRQLIKEYLEGAQSLQDEIEFSLQESQWLADEANLLCASSSATREDISSRLKTSASFLDCEPSTSRKKFDDFNTFSQADGTAFKSSPDIFEDAYTDLFMDPQSSASDSDSKTQVHEKEQHMPNRKLNTTFSESNVKVAITHPILQEKDTEKSKAETLLDAQVENMFLEKSMSSWKPCMSPKDEPLPSFRFKKKKQQIAISSSTQDKKVQKYLSSFKKIASSIKRKQKHSSNLIQLNKPFLLLHHGSLARKACKLDNYDFITGVTDRIEHNESEDDFIPCNTHTRAKSAFHRVKPSTPGRLISYFDQNTPAKTTRSGATYGSQKLLKSEPEDIETHTHTSPEIILDDCFNDEEEDTSSDGVTQVDKHMEFHDNVDTKRKLPTFSDIKYKPSNVIVPTPIVKKESCKIEASLKPNCSLQKSLEKIPIKEEQLENMTDKDYSSDSSSSLIDVETIVDDEIEEFVLKRKLTPNTHKPSYVKSTCHSKKMKKNES